MDVGSGWETCEKYRCLGPAPQIPNVWFWDGGGASGNLFTNFADNSDPMEM